MTDTPDRQREGIEEEASVWLVRLSEAPQDAELRALFESWLGTSSLHAEIWARTVRAYHLIGEGPAAHGAHWQSYAAARRGARNLPSARPSDDAGPHRTGRGRTRSLGRSSRKRPIGLAAAAITLCLAVAVGPQALLRLQADLVTTTAELQSATLEDGSRILLAPESAVELRFSETAREVHLIQGQAFFEVERDLATPFRVIAGETVVTVLGTAFEVDFAGGTGRVAVQHGRVGVAAAGNRSHPAVELGGGEWLLTGDAGAAARGHLAPEGIAAWRNGELIIRDRPVSEIVAVLRRYHRGAILLQDEAFAARRISGIYSLGNPAETLSNLAAAHGAKVTAISPWLLVVTER